MRDPEVSSNRGPAPASSHRWLVLQGQTDATGRHQVSHVSHASLRTTAVLGISEAQLMADATLLWRVLQPDHGTALESALNAAVLANRALEAARPIDTTLALLNGPEPRWLRFRIGMAPSDGGTEVAWDAIVEDVTQKTGERNHLAEQAAYHAMLFQQSPPAMMVLEPTRGFVDCNDASVRLYGFPNRASLLGKMPRDLCADGLCDGSAGYLDQALAHGAAVFEWRQKRFDGRLFDARIQLLRLDHRGKTLLQFATEDITQRKQDDKQLVFLLTTVENYLAERGSSERLEAALKDIAPRMQAQVQAPKANE